MDTDDLDPRKRQIQPRALDDLGIGELNDYIQDLETEIGRARAMIAAKQAARAGADAFFKKG